MLEAAAELLGLGRGGDRQPGRAAGERGVGAAVGAVPVAVGLDHRAELGAVAQLRLQPGAVGANRVEVDPGDRPLHRASRRRARRRALIRRAFDRPAPQPRRDRVDHVGGDHRLGAADPPAASRPARAWARTAAQAAANGSRPRASSAAVDAGEDVAAAGGGEAGGGERVDGDPLAVGDDRVVALEDDDRAGGRGRLAGGGEPVGGDLARSRGSSRRPSSPACGVRTVGAGRGGEPRRAGRRRR